MINKIHLIVFSKNRACQADALLQSIEKNGKQINKISALIQPTTFEHAQSYIRLCKMHPKVNIVYQKNFRSDLLKIIQENIFSNLMFATDDGLCFMEFPFCPEPDWERVASISLRLGRNSRYCHPADEHYFPPKFQATSSLLAWHWRKAQGDFRVVYSLDAHIYPRDRFLNLLEKIDFENPNQLEDRLNRFFSEDAPERMLCPEQSCYVSLPINRVNTEFANRSGLQYPVSEEELLARFLSGQRLDVKNIVSSVPNGPHQEYPLRWIQ